MMNSDVFLKLDKINDKINMISVNVAEISVNLHHNTQDVKEHMRRTDVAEKRLDILETDTKSWKKAFIIISSSLGVLSTISAIAYSIFRII